MLFMYYENLRVGMSMASASHMSQVSLQVVLRHVRRAVGHK